MPSWGLIVCRDLFYLPELYLNLVFSQFRSSDEQSFRRRFKPNHCYSKGSTETKSTSIQFSRWRRNYSLILELHVCIYLLSTEAIIDLTVVINPGGRKSGSGTPFSVSDTVGMETDELLKVAAEEGFGQRKQGALKALVRCDVI